jgi:hypothetical protein
VAERSEIARRLSLAEPLIACYVAALVPDVGFAVRLHQ